MLIQLACARGDADVCLATQTGGHSCGLDANVDMRAFQIPENFDIDKVVHEVTKVGVEYTMLWTRFCIDHYFRDLAGLC